MLRDLTFDAIVCTKGRPDELRNCLRAFAVQTKRPTRIIVVIAGVQEPDLVGIDGVPLEIVDAEAGLPKQRNVGLGRARSDLVGFFDDDVVLEPSYVAGVTSWFAEHPVCVGVSGNILNDPYRARLSRAFRAVFALANDDGSVLSSGDAMYLYHPSTPTLVDVLSGSNMVFRRSAVDGLRFDEVLHGYAYMEDVDFSLRAGRRGELWALPHARLLHHKTSTERIPPRTYVAQVLGNGAYVFAKHKRTQEFRWTAYLRRLVGRVLAYVLVGIARRSPGPILGVVDGLVRVPRMLARGLERGCDEP